MEVVFESRPTPREWTNDLFSGSEPALEALGRARAFYRLAFETGSAQPTVPVFVALMCARVLLTHTTLDLLAAQRGMTSAQERRYLGTRFREALETLAVLFGYASGAKQ